MGYPVNWRGNLWTRRQRAKYAVCPWRSGPFGITKSNRNPDVVLVDCRFRVACVAATGLNVSPETIIVVHDFWAGKREYYEPALTLLHPIDRADSLGVFRISSASVATAKRIFATHRYDPR